MAQRKSKRRAKHRTAARRGTLRIAVWLLGLGVLGAVAGALSLAALFYYYGSDPTLPRMATARDYRPKEVTRIFDREGVLIAELAAQRRTVVPFDKIPKLLIKAAIAAEDAQFYSHRGLDYLGMLRALIANVRAGRFAQGGSTITQQVVKTFFLSPERTIKRKVQEVMLAQRLEHAFSKDEILYLYLNQIYFGHGRYGVEEASRFFFGKSVEKIGLAECALLAGLPQSPERLSPLKHPQRAKRRQTYVLRRMAELGYISRQVARHLVDEPIRLVRYHPKLYNTAPEVADIVRKELVRRFGDADLATLGEQVYTTVDAKLEVAARESLRWGLRAIDAREKYREPLRRLRGKRIAIYDHRLERRQTSFHAGHRYQGIVRAVDDKQQALQVDLGSRTVRVAVDDERYNPESHSASARFSIGDVISVRCRAKDHFVFDPGPQGALVAMDPRTGEVIAMVGGYTYRRGGFDRVLRAKRQPGSAFKPFVYAAALDSGKYTPATLVVDAPVVVNGFKPRNFEGEYRGEIRLRVALAHSVNTVAVRLLDALKDEPVRTLARRMGITSELKAHDLSLALGSSEVSPIEMVTAYSAIANGGRRVWPRYVQRVGDEPWKADGVSSEPEQALRPEVAYVLAHMMQSVIEEGTARRARVLGRPAAGKTGTTNEQRDAWFVGFTPQLAVAVWVGFDQPRPLGKGETGSRAALPIWIRFMQRALRGKPKLPFAQPPGVTVLAIDPQTGLLAAPGAPDAIDEVFVEGTEPKEQAPLADEVDPNTILMGTTIP